MATKNRKQRRAARLVAQKQQQPIPMQNSKDNQRHLVASQMQQESFSGPLPHPDHLERYGAIIQGGAERIFKMAEDQAQHRMSIEKDIVQSDIKLSRQGLLYGFLIAIVVTGGGLWIAILNSNPFGYVAMLTPLATILGLFIYNRRGKSQDQTEQRSKK